MVPRVVVQLSDDADAARFGAPLAEVGAELLQDFEGDRELDLIVLDRDAAPGTLERAKALKRDSVHFVPLLLAAPAGADVAPWLADGFDDVVDPRGEPRVLAARLANLLRSSRQSRELLRTGEADGHASHDASAGAHESAYRTLFEQASDAILLLSEQNQILECNGRVRDVLGYSVDELRGTDAAALVHPDDWGEKDHGASVAALMRGDTLRNAYRMRRRDGSYVHTEVSTRRLDDGRFMNVVRDISRRVADDEALRSQARLISAITDMSPAILYVYDLLTQENVFINSGMERLLGYSAHDIRAMGAEVLAEIVHEEDLPRVLALHDRIFAADDGDVLSIEYRMRHKDGTWRWLRSDERVFLRDEEGRVTQKVGVAIDITERLRAEETIRASDANLRALIDNRDDYIWSMDRDYGFVTWNQTYEAMFRRKHGCELHPGLDALQFLSAEEREFWVPMCEGAYAGENVLREFSHELDGELRFFQLSLHPIRSGEQVTGISAISRDVTDRVRAEQARRLLETAIEHAVECVVLCDAEHRIEYINRAFTELTGHAAADVLGQTPRSWASEPRDGAVLDEIETRLRAGEPWRGSMRLSTKDGGHREVQSTVAPVRDEEGGVTHSVWVHRDVTREREWERRHQQAQRLEAIGTLAGGIAHDFNNILSPLVVCAELAYEALPEDSEASDDLREVRAAAARATELVRQILSFSRHSASERHALVAGPIVKEALKLIRATLPATIEIITEIEADLPTISADPIEIHQVVMNLCTNALHAMPQGGRLTVGLAGVVVDGELARRLPELRAGRHLRLEVRDTGQGIAPELLDKIFEPYFTTKGPERGTGLGLATTHSIVRACGGAIDVRSEEGQGTEFRLYFPEVEAACSVEPRTRQRARRGGGERVLLVDDEAAIARVVARAMGRRGFEVTSVTDPEDALRLVREDADAFDVVVTDMTMPGLTGDQLSRELLALRPDLPIILCTGFSERLDAAEIGALGVRRLMGKPVMPDELSAAIREVLGDPEA